jgi:phosphoglycolate phosphatase-like HAD superfamily hydrolase
MSIDKVILDFDNTLFDTGDFKVALASSLAPFGITDELFWGTYLHARDVGDGGCTYRFEKHVDLLTDRAPLDRIAALASLKSVLSRAEDFLYPDAKEFLSRLIALGVPTIVLTHGDPEFQRAKLAATGVDKLVDEVLATDRKKIDVMSDIVGGDKGLVYFVNDHLDETVSVKNAEPRIIPILKRRPDLPPERYLGLRMLYFRTLSEIRDYLTIVHATHPKYA